MTKIEVNPGACGFSVRVTAVEDGYRKVMITIETDCQQIKELYLKKLNALLFRTSSTFPSVRIGLIKLQKS